LAGDLRIVYRLGGRWHLAFIGSPNLTGTMRAILFRIHAHFDERLIAFGAGFNLVGHSCPSATFQNDRWCSTNHDSAPQGAFEDERDAALRSLCRRAICPMSIPATSTNAT
jgi:hypothetical protein